MSRAHSLNIWIMGLFNPLLVVAVGGDLRDEKTQEDPSHFSSNNFVMGQDLAPLHQQGFCSQAI